MVFGKDCVIGKNAESQANVVEKLDNEEEDINFEEDDFTNTNNMMGTDEVQSMSFSEAPRWAQSQSQCQKRQSARNGEAYEALKESSYVITGDIEKSLYLFE